MNKRSLVMGFGASLTLLGALAVAQNAAPPASAAPKPPAPSNAQIDAGEPRADTSVAPVQAPEPAATPAPPAAKPVTTGRSAKPTAPKAPGGTDRLDLNTATVTGDREQPKVMYIVPWKSSDIGDLSGKPMNSLLDEALAPVDRDEFRREVAYYDAVKADRAQNGPATPAAAKQGEK